MLSHVSSAQPAPLLAAAAVLFVEVCASSSSPYVVPRAKVRLIAFAAVPVGKRKISPDFEAYTAAAKPSPSDCL